MTVSTFLQKSSRGSIETLVVDNALGRAEIALFGGHVIAFTPHHDNRQRLWLSPVADLTGKKPIRGGIPVCWPWFSDDHGRAKGELPSHGFLRNQVWQLVETQQNEDKTTVILSPPVTSGEGFGFKTDVALHITVGRELCVSLVTKNTDIKQFTFNAALHTYFQVDNVSKTELLGLSGNYKDKLSNWQETPTPSPYVFSGETDRIHLNPVADNIISTSGTSTLVKHQGHDSIVVWNPWRSAASIADMDAFGYKHMLCVETAITQGVVLNPGDSRALTQIIA